MAQIPGPRENDLDDVSVALEVAQTQWGRGDHTEALKWLRKAAEAAFEGGDDRRGIELSKVIAGLSAEARSAKTAVRASKPSLPSVPAIEPVVAKPAAPKAVAISSKPSAAASASSLPAKVPYFGPPRPASFPPPPLSARPDETPRIDDSSDEFPTAAGPLAAAKKLRFLGRQRLSQRRRRPPKNRRPRRGRLNLSFPPQPPASCRQRCVQVR
jgi:hypothetical protein